MVARWGGDEFCVVGPGPGHGPLELERRVRETVSLQPPGARVDSGIRKVSAGGAMLAPWDAGSLDTLLGKADQEMYLRRALRREGPVAPRRAPPRPNEPTERATRADRAKVGHVRAGLLLIGPR